MSGTSSSCIIAATRNVCLRGCAHMFQTVHLLKRPLALRTIGRFVGLSAAIGVSLVTLLLHAATASFVQTSLTDQVRRADYVAYGLLSKAELIEVVDGGQRETCGTVYTMRAIEQFRGSLPSTFQFTSVVRPGVAKLDVGSRLLVLLNDTTRHAASEMPSLGYLPTQQCKERLPTLYAAIDRENIFLVDKAEATDIRQLRLEALDNSDWLFYGDATSIPDEIAGVVAKRCHTECDNCWLSDPARVPWKNIRAHLAQWSSERR